MHECKTDRGPGEEEWNDEKGVKPEEPQEIQLLGDHLEGVERHLPQDEKSEHDGKGVDAGGEGEERPGIGLPRRFREGEVCAARAEAEEHHADHHEGEVVPDHEGKDPREGDLEEEGAERSEEDP